jgi:hypothetical protein
VRDRSNKVGRVLTLPGTYTKTPANVR